MATTGRRNYIVFVMDGKVAFAGTQKAYEDWKYWHVPGQGIHGVRLEEVARHGMVWEYFTYKKDMEKYVSDYPNVPLSESSAQALLASAICGAYRDAAQTC